MNPRFFFGANTRYGFRGFLSRLYDPKRDRVVLIKGSPGSGKNTMMRAVRSRLTLEGIPFEEIRCSSDPASLDGLIVSSLHKAIFDATAPHVMEPQYWGVCETLADLSRFLCRNTLEEAQDSLIALSEECARLHRKSCAELSKAAFVREEYAASLEKRRNSRAVVRAACSLAERFFPKNPRCGAGASPRERCRFLSAAAPGEICFLKDSLEALAENRFVFYDPYGLCAPLFMNVLHEAAAERGLSMIRCRCPVLPEVDDHLIFPEISLAVSVASALSPLLQYDLCYTEFFAPAPGAPPINPEIYLRRACEYSAEAKKTHDRLEAIYQSAMDFSAAAQETERVLQFFFG